MQAVTKGSDSRCLHVRRVRGSVRRWDPQTPVWLLCAEVSVQGTLAAAGAAQVSTPPADPREIRTGCVRAAPTTCKRASLKQSWV